MTNLDVTPQRRWQPGLDLEWLRHAPLLVSEGVDVAADLRPRLPAVIPDYALASIDRFCNRRDHGRLGRYFEEMLAAGWMLDPRIRRLVSSIQIANRGITEGELDFVMQTAAGWQHVEVAVKFYFGTKVSADPMTWAGPNQIDKLGLKLGRLYDKQLVLSDTAKRRLADRGITVQGSSCLVFGTLFYHPHIDTPPPEGLSGGHDRSWWVHVDELGSVPLDGCEAGALVWSILPRQQWLHGQADERFGWGALPGRLQAAFAQHPLPRLVAGYADGVEVTRGFVAPNGWLAALEARYG